MPGLNYPGAPPAPPSGDEVFNLTSAPEGGWSVIQQAKAVYYNDKTYFAWINGTTGALKIASYDHSTETTSTATQLDSMGGNVDDHNNPGILVRDSDKRLLVAMCLICCALELLLVCRCRRVFRLACTVAIAVPIARMTIDATHHDLLCHCLASSIIRQSASFAGSSLRTCRLR